MEIYVEITQVTEGKHWTSASAVHVAPECSAKSSFYSLNSFKNTAGKFFVTEELSRNLILIKARLLSIGLSRFHLSSNISKHTAYVFTIKGDDYNFLSRTINPQEKSKYGPHNENQLI